MTSFDTIAISPGGTVTGAFLQFTPLLNESSALTLLIRCELGHSALLQNKKGAISDRSFTASSVSWTVPAWTTNSSGPATRTPNLSAIVQEAINHLLLEPGVSDHRLPLRGRGQHRQLPHGHGGQQPAVHQLHRAKYVVAIAIADTPTTTSKPKAKI
jgi:hypothetical protein